MQLILELLKKIFVALQGVYTKAETDSALGLKADASALEAEAQARKQADAKHDAELDRIEARANSIQGGACVMYVDIPPDDGSSEYWIDDPTSFARVYNVVLPKIGTGSGSAIVDWGDGKSDEIKNSTASYVTHAYLSQGRHWIVLSGNVVSMTLSLKDQMSAIAHKDENLLSSYAAGIGIKSLTIDTITSATSAFGSFLADNVFVRANNCSLQGAFTNVGASQLVVDMGSKRCSSLMVWGYTPSVIVRTKNNTESLDYVAYGRYVSDCTLEWGGTVLPARVLFWSSDSKTLRSATFLMPNLERFLGIKVLSGKSALWHFGAGLPSLKNGSGLFENTNLDKPSVLRVLNALPDRTGVEPEQDGDGIITFTSNVATAAINNIDAEIQLAIDAARNKNWTVEV